MFLRKKSEAQGLERDRAVQADERESMRYLRSSPLVSDVHTLSVPNSSLARVDEGQRVPTGLIPPSFGTTTEALAELGWSAESLPAVPEFVDALKSGNDVHAIAWLLRENAVIRQELTSVRADFEGLRAMNVSIQEQYDAILSSTDDERLTLALELEQAKDHVFELEAQQQESRTCWTIETEQLQLQQDVLQSEIFELRAQLASRS
jgi:uncharacterized membrane protein